jgi:RecJ-like exonuclease
MRIMTLVDCPACGGKGQWEHPLYQALDEAWRAGRLWDEEAVAVFWAERGYDYDNPPPQHVYCHVCDGTGNLEVYAYPEHERKALAAWRAQNSLVDRLIQLHERSMALARSLAEHIEQYYERHNAGACCCYQGLVQDVVRWPRRSHG